MHVKAQLDLFDYMNRETDIDALKGEIERLQYGDIFHNDVIVIKKNTRFFDLSLRDDFHECFCTAQQLIDFIKKNL